MNPPELSVIITCYQEEVSIAQFYGRLRKTLEESGRSFEIVLVNDGSTDGTWSELRRFHAREPHVTVLDLFRNSGQLCAMTAGLEQARGRSLVFIDSDLQLDPEELPRLLAEFDKGFDVVSGARRNRQDSLSRAFFSYWANLVLRAMTGTGLTDLGCTFKVYRGDLVRAHRLGPERPFNPPNVIRSAGRSAEVPVTHHARPHGVSGWTFPKLFRYNLDNMLSCSQTVFQYLSALAFLVAFLTFVRILLAWVWPVSILSGGVTTGLILNAMLLSVALLLGVLAILGEYVLRIYNRQLVGPQYVVRELLAAWDDAGRACYDRPTDCSE